MDLSIRVRRMGYRLAYSVLRVYWFVVRPRSHGVKCVLTDAGRVLLVRHTYGPRAWELPGGAVKRREPPEDAVRREIEEELGLALEDVVSLGSFAARMDRRRDIIHCFMAEIDRSKLVLDPVEIKRAEWFARDELPPRLGRYVERILERLPG